MQTDHHTGTLLRDPDVVLIGGGIMSATLGILLKQLNPALTIQIIEGLPKVALESSHGWNNAGTGHAALCELNYTPMNDAGEVDISKAVKINEQFETSKHFWGYLVEQGIISDPDQFIRRVPHMSFVRGEKGQDFLRRRYETMVKCPLFEAMQYTTDHAQISEWSPLLNAGREAAEPLAATRVERGTDVNYGALTRKLVEHLVSLDGVQLATKTKVRNITRGKADRWKIELDSTENGRCSLEAAFVFNGAGGGALPLLQKSGIPEGRGFGGFPVSGQFLVCTNQAIVEQHAAKVYGMAAVGAPPMSVPHLDTRVIDGNRALLFGPYAGFSPKFLKTGSNLDLFTSVKPGNLLPMLAAGRDNMPLTKYLINECRKSHNDRCNSLREFFPDAKDEDWKLINAGQRVQIIKKDPQRTGRLQFGTEVVTSADGSLSSVLGASPGASTAVSILLEVLEKSFPAQMATEAWRAKLAAMVPAYGLQLADDKTRYTELAAKADEKLRLN